MGHLRGSSSNVWLVDVDYFMGQAISYSECVFYSTFGTVLLCQTTNENVNRAHWPTGPALQCSYLWCGGTPQQAAQVSILKRKVFFTWGTSFTFPVWLGARNNFFANLEFLLVEGPSRREALWLLLLRYSCQEKADWLYMSWLYSCM